MYEVKNMPKAIDPLEIKQTWSSVEDLGQCIFVYRNIYTKEMDLINRLESVLSAKNNFNWQDALVGHQQKIPGYRDCVDFKYRKSDLHGIDQYSEQLRQIWQDCYDSMYQATQDYCYKNKIVNLNYWEVMNFVKYGEGHHFQEHTDHGFSYNSTVSLVGYLNDDYEGGELYFRLQDLNIKPQAGDLYVFPSSFTHPHRAMPVTKGIKYSLVTMLDYNAKFHTSKFYTEKTND
jgi:hypothetical protein